MKNTRAMSNGLAVLDRGLWSRGNEWDTMGRALRSMRSIQNGQSLRKRNISTNICERCGQSPAQTQARRPMRGLQCTTSIRSLSTSISPRPWQAASPAQRPTSHPDTAVPLPEQLRSIMRLLTHSVVVCTSVHGTTPRAMTMSSFTSLTLSPTPLITFNILAPSRTLDAIVSSGKFNVHILAGDPGGVAVASHFTKGNIDSNLFGDLNGVVDCDSDGVLRGEGVLFALRCRVLNDAPEGGLVRVRDHVIVIGEVLEMVPVSEKEEFGLAYADRRYREVGEVVERDGDE